MSHPVPPSARKRRSGPLEAAPVLLFLAAFPLILLLFHGTATSAFAAVLQLVLLALALRLIHRGQQVEEDWFQNRSARPPRLPRKTIGSALIGLTLLLLAGHHFATLWLPLGFGLLGMALSLAAFGRDPLRGSTAVQDRARRAQIEAALGRVEAVLKQQVDKAASLGDAELAGRAEGLRITVMALLRALSEDPAEAKRLRRPVARFLELFAAENDRLHAAWETEDRPKARLRYLARIAALGEAFEDRARETGLAQGRDAFEIEADLLWTRMYRHRAA